MSQKKAVSVIYVDPIPKEKSAIGMDVPAHAKLEWVDEQGRRTTHLLIIPDKTLELIKGLPDVPPPCIGYPDCDGDLPGNPHEEKCPRSRFPADRQRVVY